MNPNPNPVVQLQRWGLVPYAEAWERQKALMQSIIDIKTANRALPPDQQRPTPNYLVTVQHPPVYTMGKNAKPENLLLKPQQLEALGIELYYIERGGDATYHGPGQLVVYPILDLENFFTDLGRLMRSLEEAVIRTLAAFGILADRWPGNTGVWLAPGTPAARKICAMGLKCSRWVSMHGLALNVHTRVEDFGGIVPCGIANAGVTSLHRELPQPPGLAAVEARLLDDLAQVFGFQYEKPVLA